MTGGVPGFGLGIPTTSIDILATAKVLVIQICDRFLVSLADAFYQNAMSYNHGMRSICISAAAAAHHAGLSREFSVHNNSVLQPAIIKPHCLPGGVTGRCGLIVA